MIAQVLAPKYCLFCKQSLQRRLENSGKLETIYKFTRRKFCSLRCKAKGRYYPPLTNPESSRQQARRRKGAGSCEKCNSAIHIDVHHKDGNPLNNNPENLMWLCRSCHALAHSKKGKCTICGRPQNAKGLCNKHYLRRMKYGDPLLTKKWGGGHDRNVVFRSI